MTTATASPAPPGTAALTLPVSEVFGPTLQGEGPHAGRPCGFVRLGGCNLSCSWCDTPYTWDGSRHDLRTEITARGVDEILREVARMDVRMVVLTGGEPLLHQHRPGWMPLLTGLSDMAWVHVETNGTLPPTPFTANPMTVRHFSVSPKLLNAGRHRGRQDPALHGTWPELATTRTGVIAKVVCTSADDVAQAVTLLTRAQWPRDAIWVMPEGATPEQLTRTWPAVAEAAAAHRVNATHRLHTLAWGDARCR